MPGSPSIALLPGFRPRILGGQHGPPCQQTRPVNRRKRRIGHRNVGLQRGPWGFVLDSRQSESPTGEKRTAKYSRNVGDNGGARNRCCQRKRPGNSGQRDGGSPAWIRTTIKAGSTMCVTCRKYNRNNGENRRNRTYSYNTGTDPVAPARGSTASTGRPRCLPGGAPGAGLCSLLLLAFRL